MKYFEDYKAQIMTMTLMFYYAISLPWITKYTEIEMMIMQKLRYLPYAIFLFAALHTLIKDYQKEGKGIVGYLTEHLLLIVVVLTALAIAIATTHLQPFIFVVMLLSIADSGFDKHIKYIFYVHLAFMILTILLYQFGILEQVTIGRNGSDIVRQSLGYIYPLDFHGHFFFIVLMYIYIKKETFNLSDALFINLTNILMYQFTDARSDFIWVVLVSLLAYGLTFAKREKILEKIPTICYEIFMALAVLVPFLLVKIYDPNIAWMKKLNSILSGRLNITSRVLSETGIPIFGKYLDWYGFGYTGDNLSHEYNWIDFSFIKDTVDYGVIFVILLAIGFVFMLKRCHQNQDIYGVMIVVFLVLGSILEYHTFMPHIYPIILMMTEGILLKNQAVMEMVV